MLNNRPNSGGDKLRPDDQLRPDDRLPDTLPRGDSSVDHANAVLGQKQGGQ